jgi:hypothetical protein
LCPNNTCANLDSKYHHMFKFVCKALIHEGQASGGFTEGRPPENT